ncbi:MAG: aspartate--tRNA ligase [Planctomycetales bacterium 4484_123]|nr:MAG: aspartate--tRNA ligase [Planctomycetales bacterium 4484_123]
MAEPSDAALKRTHNCGELRSADVGKHVRLCGWVRSYRDHGGVVFVDLRDREGITQIVFDPSGDAETHALARALRNEWVISTAGVVRPRGTDRVNPKLPTGEIEVLADDLVVLNRSDPVPIDPEGNDAVAEETRLRFRYIDLRRPEMARNIRMRHAICRAMRSVLDEMGFIEVETPFLTKSTPEGARDFLVPSRLQPGEFYALPQSPQLFKQILMVSGLERYYQIVRCFRDEDLRADRQPEFTQLDLEMSFATEADVMEVTNAVFRRVCEAAGRSFPDDVPVLSYSQAMERYGTDRPDMRFELQLRDVSEIVRGTDFNVFAGVLAGAGVVKGLCVPGGAKFTRKEIDQYGEFAAAHGAKGLAWCKVQAEGFAGGVAKFLDAAMQARLREAFGAADGDLLMFIADAEEAANKALAALRNKLGADLKLYDPEAFAWCWVTGFPLVEWNEQEGRWDSLHHPFTSPALEDLDILETDPAHVSSRAYDIVLNGVELGGGSVRIHDMETQRRVFRLLGIAEEEAELRFGFFLQALRYGAPPHGGIALGIDRIVMMMVGASSLREVIAFPKTQRGVCPLTGAPAPADARQLRELGIRLAPGRKGPEGSGGQGQEA